MCVEIFPQILEDVYQRQKRVNVGNSTVFR